MKILITNCKLNILSITFSIQVFFVYVYLHYIFALEFLKHYQIYFILIINYNLHINLKIIR